MWLCLVLKLGVWSGGAQNCYRMMVLRCASGLLLGLFSVVCDLCIDDVQPQGANLQEKWMTPQTLILSLDVNFSSFTVSQRTGERTAAGDRRMTLHSCKSLTDYYDALPLLHQWENQARHDVEPFHHQLRKYLQTCTVEFHSPCLCTLEEKLNSACPPNKTLQWCARPVYTNPKRQEPSDASK